MLNSYKLGQGSIVLRLKLRDSSVTTGAGKTGLTSSSSGLRIATSCDNEATATAYTQAGSTIESITTLGTYAAPTSTKCRFKEYDSTNHPGLYEIQIADARFAVSSAKFVIITVSGVTNLAECDVLIPLRSFDPYDAVRGGLTALPNVASGSAGALLVDGTGTAAISNSSGKVLLQATQTGVTIPTVTNVGTLTTYTGNTPQTGDSYARLGVPAGASISADIASVLTAVQNVQNNTFISTSIPMDLAIPTSGSTAVQISVVFCDETGTAKNLDSGNPTMTLVSDAGTDKSSRLGSWSNPATGKYTINYTNTSTDALEGLHWDVSGTINSKLRRLPAYTQIVAVYTSTFTSSDRTTLNNIAAVSPANAPSVDSSGRVDVGKILGVVSKGAAGSVSVDWSNIVNPTATVGLSGTTVGTATTLTNAPLDSSGTTTLLSRLTSSRAGYLDNLNVGGSVASHADTAAINQSASKHLLLSTVGQYAPGETYTIECRTFSAADGSAVNADSTPTFIVTGSVSGSLAGNLGSVTNPSTGVYRATYTVPSSPTLEQIRVDASAVIASSTFTLSAYSQTVDQPTAVFTSTDKSNLTAIYNKLPVNGIADEAFLLAAIPTAVQIRQEMDSNSTRLAGGATATGVVTAESAILAAVGSPLQTSAYTTPPTAASVASATATAIFVDGTTNKLKVNSDHSVNTSGDAGTIVNYITVPSAVAVASHNPAIITCLRGDTLHNSLPLMGDIATRTKLIMTGKANVNDSDDEAIFQIDELIGLVRLNGSENVTADAASLSVVDATTGSVDLEIDASVTAAFAIRDLIWDVQAFLSTGITTPINGTMSIVADVTQAVT